MQAAPTFGPWQAVEKLGQGGVCEVWRARHGEDSSREVAIKVLADVTAENIARFVDEAALLRQIDHPNVLGVHEVAGDARPPWFVMDLLKGRDLDALRDQGPVEPRRAAEIIAQVAGGLAAVHALGVRHRDIKPGNIVIGDDGVPKLIDFGIARRIQDTHRTRQGMVVGTAAYLPPEVWSGKDPHGAQDSEAADVFALGQTLCELLIGRPIYEREGDTTLLVAILRDKLEREDLDPRFWNKSVPDGLSRIVMDATRQEAADRLKTAQALRDRLEGWLAGRDEPAPIPSKTGPASKTGPKTGPPSKTGPKTIPASSTGPKPAEPTAPRPAPTAKPVPAAAYAPDEAAGSNALAWTAGGGLLAVAALFAVTLAGVGLLWAFRPGAGAIADPLAVRVAVVEQAATLAPCAGGRPAVVTATWVVQGGAAWHTRADATTATPEATACVLAALSAMRFPDGTLAVTLPVELR